MENVFKISIDPSDEITGLDAISLVEFPAVEYNFLTFSQDEEKVLHFSNEEKRIISGVAILADVPIPRRAADGSVYYVVFDRPTIEQLVEKYSKQLLNNSVNIEHNDNDFVNDIYMIESYIKDSTRGIVPEEFKGVPDGSWIVSYKVENDEVWSKIKSGEILGFSVQGLFSLIEEKFSKNNNECDELVELRSLAHKIFNRLT